VSGYGRTDDVSGDEVPPVIGYIHPIDVPQQEFVWDFGEGFGLPLIEAQSCGDQGLVEVEAVRGRYRIAVRRGEHDSDFLWLSEGEMRDLREALAATAETSEADREKCCATDAGDCACSDGCLCGCTYCRCDRDDGFSPDEAAFLGGYQPGTREE
jgi:hypothetical protein